MRRFVLAAVAALAVAGIPAAASATSRVPAIGGGGADVTSEAALIKTTQNTPDGVQPVIYGRVLFTVHAQPLSGSIDLYLQEHVSAGWINVWHAPRVTFPLNPPVAGFAMVVGKYLCAGTNNYWRMAFLIHVEASDGTWQGPITTYYVNGSTAPQATPPTGDKFNCT